MNPPPFWNSSLQWNTHSFKKLKLTCSSIFQKFLIDWIIGGYCYITLWNTCIGIWWILNSMKRMVTLDFKESGDGVILKIFALSGQSIRNFQQMWARLCSRAWPQTQKWKNITIFSVAKMHSGSFLAPTGALYLMMCFCIFSAPFWIFTPTVDVTRVTLNYAYKYKSWWSDNNISRVHSYFPSVLGTW